MRYISAWVTTNPLKFRSFGGVQFKLYLHGNDADAIMFVSVHLLRILQWWGKTTKGPIRAVASIYSWGGGWGGGCRPKISEWRKKFPNISCRHTKPRRCLLSGKWRRNLQTQIRIFYAQTYYSSMQCHRNLYLIGGWERGPKARGNF